MIIAQISDTHITLDTPDSDRRMRDFERTIADIDALEMRPDVIVHTGDVVHNGRDEEYAEAAALLATAKSSVYVLAGNRDDRRTLRKAFSGNDYINDNSEFIEYAIDDFPVRLIMLDTLSLQSNKGDFCQKRMENLQHLASWESSKPVAVFTHHPPFEATECPEPLQFETRESMLRLRNALQKIDSVAAIFCGHVHRFDMGDVEGTRAVAMPSIATSLRKGEYPEGMKTQPVYQLHRFDPVWGFTTETRIVGTQT
jgi:3',5'-cyclic AMP phosphodiesterase CpdA